MEARVSMLIKASPKQIYDAFVQPELLRQFWLHSADGELQLDRPARWTFLVQGAEDLVTALALEDARKVAWRWSDGSTVTVELEEFEHETAVSLRCENFAGNDEAQVAAALDNTEGFSLVLSDLKTFLEDGKAAGLSRDKARLIEYRQKQ